MHALISALNGGEWSASRPGRFTPQGKTPQCSLDRRLGEPQRRCENGNEEKNSQPSQGIESQSSDRPNRSQSLYGMSYPRS
jgi:hypothetical protein